jgi:pimeloyl-ACP methyl ester carboxylesterase
MEIVVIVLLAYLFYHVAFILLQPKLIFQNRKLQQDFSFTAPLPVTEINLTTTDGATLNATLQLPENMKGIVIYFHGNKHHLQRYLPYTKKFIEHNYAVLMPDYRSYGKSTGKLNEELFLSDSKHFFDYLIKNYPEKEITIYGRSLGTAPATWLASQVNCKQLILEAPFCNMNDLSKWYGMFLPIGRFLRFQLHNDLNLQKVKCRVTIIHGTHDTTVPVFSGRKLKMFLKPEDQFVEITKGNHHNLEQTEIYNEVMDQLLAF